MILNSLAVLGFIHCELDIVMYMRIDYNEQFVHITGNDNTDGLLLNVNLKHSPLADSLHTDRAC